MKLDERTSRLHWPPRLARLSERRALTLIELLIVVAIIAILAAIGMVQMQRAKVRANVVASKSNLRMVAAAMQIFRADNGTYPPPLISVPSDPFGVVAQSSLRSLTTPISYITTQAFTDPFGAIQIQGTLSGAAASGMPQSSFNAGNSILAFQYPQISQILQQPLMGKDGFALVSLGPDTKDSFVIFFPFPEVGLPARAQLFGINSIADTLYDPTNGAVSGGDLAVFGGDLNVPQFVGGGDP